MTRRLVIFCTLAACLVAWLPRRACAEASREYQLKAAFLYNFAQFVEWPADIFPDAKSPIVIGVAGDDPFDGALDRAIAGKTVGGRPLAVRHISRAEETKGCHLLYVPAEGEQDLAALIRRIGVSPVLTVGETDRFMAHGGIVRFYLEDNKLRFEINVDAAQRSHLRVSAKLLRLARVRHDERRSAP